MVKTPLSLHEGICPIMKFLEHFVKLVHDDAAKTQIIKQTK
jgi:hypothetical protein